MTNSPTRDSATAMERTQKTLAGHAVDRANIALLVTLALGVFAGALDLGVLAPALPALAHGFGVAPRDVAWVFTLYLCANVLSIPIAAKLSDTVGRRAVYIVCVSVFAVGSVVAIAAPNFAIFLIARAVQAAGAGGIFPVATAAIGDRVPLERRGAALGLLGAVWGLAAVIGPLFGGIVTHALSWRWIFAANVPLAVLVIARARRHVPGAAPHIRGPLDVAGIAVLAVALLASMMALTHPDIATASLTTPLLTAASGIIAIAAVVALALIERRAADPIISPRLFASTQLRVTYVVEMLIGALEGALFFVPAALVAAEHLSYATAGLVAAVAAAVFVVVIPLAGRALDAFGSRAVLAAGALCTGAGLAAFGIALPHLWLALPALVVAGIGFGSLLGAPTRYIITNAAPAERRGAALGLLSVLLIIGQIIGGSLAGGVVGSSIGDATGYAHAYLVFGAIAAVTACATLLLASRERERHVAKAAA